MSTSAVAAGSGGTLPVDESTRLLCVGAHLDRDFADTAVREFLTEPQRAMPPSPGVDAGAVLRECLVARHRRRVRDGILGALMLVFLVTGAWWLLLWVFAAMGWRHLVPQRRRLDGGSRALQGTNKILSLAAVGVLAVFLAMGGVLAAAFAALQGRTANQGFGFGSGYGTDYGTGYGTDYGGGAGVLSPSTAFWVFVLPMLLSSAMFAVLWMDRHLVWTAMVTRLRRGRFTPLPVGPVTGWRGLYWGTGNSNHALNLSRIDATPVNCVVYRGTRPFVGSGQPYRPWSIAIALEPAHLPEKHEGAGSAENDHTGSEEPQGDRLSIIELHGAVAQDLLALVGETSLSPNHRLSGLRCDGMVFVPARALVTHHGEPELAEVFPNLDRRPRSQVPGPFLQYLAGSPKEWARYYATYVVESWDREVTVSLLMHYGLDQRNLYIECIPCILPPVDARYRAVDSLGEDTSDAFVDAVGSWIVLPLTVVQRTVHAVRGIKDVFYRSRDPERFGAVASLREIAAGDGYEDYSQVSDVNRYVQILQTRVVRALGAYLESHDISVVDFQRQAEATTVTNVWGDVYGSNIGGRHNVVRTGPRNPPGGRGSLGDDGGRT